MVTEALSSEETTVEAAITAVSGLSSYFSAVVALAVEAAITAADVAAAADLHFYCGSFRPAAFYDFSVFFFCLRCSFSLSFSRTLHSPFTLCFLMHSSSISYTSWPSMISIYLFLIIYAVNMHNVNQVTYYIEIYFKGFLWTRTACLHHSMK